MEKAYNYGIAFDGVRVALVRGSREPGQALTGAALSGVPLFEGLSRSVFSHVTLPR